MIVISKKRDQVRRPHLTLGKFSTPERLQAFGQITFSLEFVLTCGL